MQSFRNEITDYIKSKYSAEPEYLWAKFSNYAVFRHGDNKKWFAIIMDIPYKKIDRSKSGRVEILNIKINDLLLQDLLIQQEGCYRGYHFSRGNWLSVVLDGTVPLENTRSLIDTSFTATASVKKRREMRPPKEWLIPSNPKYYDVISAFNNSEIITWKQGSGIKKNDTVFLYVGSPVSAILYKCRVIETDIPFDFQTEGLTIKKLMKIQLLKRYQADSFTFDRLKTEYGIFAVRGPRGVPDSLSRALNGRDESTGG